MKAMSILLPLAALLCSCSSSYVFRRPYRDVVDAALEQCRQQQLAVAAAGRTRKAAMTYSAVDQGRRYEIHIAELYGLTHTRIRIQPLNAERTRFKVRSLRAGVNGSVRDRDNEQIWIYRVGMGLETREPATEKPPAPPATQPTE